MDLKSKKLLAAAGCLVFVICGYYAGLPMEMIKAATLPIIVYIGAQGMADHGKEAKKVENVSVTALSTTLHKRLEGLEGTIRTILNNPTRFKP